MTSLLKIAVLSLTIYNSAVALDGYETAFDTLKGLQGQWSLRSDGKTLSIQMFYEIGSNGSIVTEQFGKELSVFYRNGRNIEMIHFCNAGNQSRLRLKESGRPDLLIFETFEISNLKNGDAAHVEKIVYTLLAGHRLDLEIVWQDGELERLERYRLTKI